MERREFHPGDDAGNYPGAVLCRDAIVPTEEGQAVIRRGTTLLEALGRLGSGGPFPKLTIVVPSVHEIPQATASRELAQVLAGSNIALTPPHQGQVNLVASNPGCVRIDVALVTEVNAGGKFMVATHRDGQTVQSDDVVAVVKAANLFVPATALQQLFNRGTAKPAIRLAPFNVRHVALLASTSIREANVERAAGQLSAKLRTYGAELATIKRVLPERDQVVTAFTELLAHGAELVLVAGSILLDPEDPFLMALQQLEASLVRRGAPIDPGTMFWVAYKDRIPCFGLASCELYGRISVLDVMLPYALAGEPITRNLIAQLGYGGLLSSAYSTPDL